MFTSDLCLQRISARKVSQPKGERAVELSKTPFSMGEITCFRVRALPPLWYKGRCGGDETHHNHFCFVIVVIIIPARARVTQNKRKQSVICQILVARDKTAEILTPPPHLSTDTGPMLPLWSSPLERAGSALWYFVYLFNCLPSGWLLWEPPFDAWSKACSAEFDRCTPQLLFTLIRAGSWRFALKVCSCQMSAVCCRTRFSFRYKHLGSCKDSRARR